MRQKTHSKLRDMPDLYLQKADITGTASRSVVLVAVEAGGTVDAITASYVRFASVSGSPIVAFESLGENTSATPTFSPNGLAAKVITKRGGSALAAGDIGPVGSVAMIEFNSNYDRWELLNPSKFSHADAAGLQGGSAGEYYHLTSAERTYALADHNDKNGLQGGAAGEYYHLTAAEYSLFAAITSLVNFVEEAPTGTINGANVTFTVSNAPSPTNSIAGFIRPEGVGAFIPLVYGTDFTIAGTTITMTVAPETASDLWFTYQYTGAVVPAPLYSDAEIPTGTINGINTTFTLAHSPTATSLMGFVRQGGAGVFLPMIYGVDFTLAGSTVTTTTAPDTGSNLVFFYRYAGSGGTIASVSNLETPGGAINGVNNVFTVLNPPSPITSVRGYLRSGGAGAFFPLIWGSDFTVSGSTITLGFAPDAGSNLYFTYRFGVSTVTQASFMEETPVGAVDGVNPDFELTFLPNPTSSLSWYGHDGRLLFNGGPGGSLSGRTWTYNAGYIPQTGDLHRATYRY